MAQAYDNSQSGKEFEEAFLKQAQLNGLLARKNPVSAKFNWNGRLMLVKGHHLDYTVSNQKGKIGFFDCKSYGRDYFDFSAIDEDQLKLSVMWFRWQVPSGFVVWFRPANAVCFFSGIKIEAKGPGTRFHMSEGLFLGAITSFDLKLILGKQRGSGRLRTN